MEHPRWETVGEALEGALLEEDAGRAQGGLLVVSRTEDRGALGGHALW